MPKWPPRIRPCGKQKVAVYDQTSGVLEDERRWEGTTVLYSEGRLAKWAREERTQFDSDRAFAFYLNDYFRTNFTYSTTTSYSSESSDKALDEFFFEGRSGYCSYFAQAMATALRAVGIPAHVVTGYLGAEWNEFGRYWMVKNNMAHAWVEAYFPDEGWRRFDPTISVSPGLNGGVVMTGEGLEETPEIEPDRSQRPSFFARTGLWFDSLNTNITRQIMTFGGGNSRSFRSRIAGMDFETLLWIMGGMMASIVIFSGTTVFVRRMGYFGGRPGLKFEQNLTEILAKIAPREQGEGLMAYAARVAHTLPEEKHDASTHMVAASKMITSLRFDQGDVTPQRNKAIQMEMSALQRALKARSA